MSNYFCKNFRKKHWPRMKDKTETGQVRKKYKTRPPIRFIWIPGSLVLHLFQKKHWKIKRIFDNSAMSFSLMQQFPGRQAYRPLELGGFFPVCHFQTLQIPAAFMFERMVRFRHDFQNLPQQVFPLDSRIRMSIGAVELHFTQKERI